MHRMLQAVGTKYNKLKPSMRDRIGTTVFVKVLSLTCPVLEFLFTC